MLVQGVALIAFRENSVRSIAMAASPWAGAMGITGRMRLSLF
jgi:hypothetical protein